MSSDDYWRRQERARPLFPDALWSKPERRDATGKLAIVGGNAHGFAAVAAAYQTARQVGVGEVKVVLPDVLKKSLPLNCVFAPTNPSGGLSRQALTELTATAEWADLVLLIGDNGQNSETAGLFEQFLAVPDLPVMFNHQPTPSVISSAHSNEFRVKTFLSENQNLHSPSLGEPDFQSKKSFRKFGEIAKENNAEKTTAKSFQASLTSASMPGLAPNRQTVDDEAKRGGDGLAGRESDSLGDLTPTQDLEEEFGRVVPIILTRDAVDLIKNTAETVLNRPNTHLVVSLGQLQKLFRNVYYPRVITFSQGVKQIAETLHKFTITYPCTITLWHADHLFVAYAGQVVSQEFDQPLRVWNGEIAARAAAWQIWQHDPIQAVATSWSELTGRTSTHDW